MKIEKSTYIGYLWYSDQKQPEVLNNKVFELDIDDKTNPFIVEGQLCDNEKSISIKYVDGSYRVKIYEFAELSGDFEDKIFYANRVDGFSKLKFRQYWKPVYDDNCNGFDVLQPAEYVFVGFEK